MQRAEALRVVLGSLVSAVVPVASRIAEAVNTGALSVDDLEALMRWARLEPARRERLRTRPKDRNWTPRSAAAEHRERLLALLGRYGIRLALELADSGDPFNQVTLARRLRELSGIGDSAGRSTEFSCARTRSRPTCG